MERNEAIEVWARLAAHGTVPTEITRAAHVLPSYTAGIGPWIDRLSIRYLRGTDVQPGLCQSAAHIKLVLAPYGGGKTHFLLTLGARALDDGFAVSYVPCGEAVSLESPLDVHRQLIRNLLLPGKDQFGLPTLVDTVTQSKRTEIDHSPGVADVDAAFSRWVRSVRRTQYPEISFGRVMAKALESADRDDDSDLREAAELWLQGELDRLPSAALQELRLANIPAAGRKQFGRNLMLSTVQFLPNAGVHGLVLLLDEAETLFTNRSQKALLRLLTAMRVMVDLPDGVPGGVPLFTVISAVPDVLEDFERYPALQQRLAVFGAPFDSGNDFASQLPLDRVLGQEKLLQEIGEKLVDFGSIATNRPFDVTLQQSNIRQLVRVASERHLDVDARRVFVKTWVNILQTQATNGERKYDHEELNERYQGNFEQLENAHADGFEP